MKKYNKILTSILAGTIILTSLSTITNNSHAEAKRINGRTKTSNQKTSNNSEEIISFIDSNIVIMVD